MLLALAALPDPARGAARHLVLVSVDGARPGDSWAVPPAPGKDAVLASARVVTPSIRTFPATVSLLTGRGPERTGVTDEWSRGAPAAGPTLAGALAAAGVRGLALPADPLLHGGTNIGRGFERFAPWSTSLAETARVDSALAWLRLPGRRFVWLEFRAANVTPVWRRDASPGWRDDSSRAHRQAEIAAAIARLVRGLPASDVALVVVGTHGAAILGEASPPDPSDVPVLIRAPRGTKLPAGATTISLLGVAPTLLDLAGASRAGFDGRSLVGAREVAPPARAPAPVPDPCEVALREWVANPPARHDSVARARATRLRESCPDGPVQAIEEAVAFSIGGREAQAATLFQSMSARFAGDHRVAIAYADHLMRFERYEMVRGAVAAIPRESPLAADAAWRIALAAAAKLDFAAAHQAFTEAATLSVPAAWSGVAASMPRLAAAAATVDREPRNVDAKIAYGQALAEFGAMDQAYGQLNQSRFLDTTRVEADYWIAFYLMRDGRALHATRALERALARDPGHRPSRILMAEALASGDDWRKAIPHFERALEQDPSDARSQYNLACLKARAGEVEAAIAALERALAAGYDDWAQIETDPDLEPVRTHPGFARLRERRPGSR